MSWSMRSLARRSGTAVGAAALLLAAGCIDDPTLVDDDPIPLSREDAQLLGLEVWRAFFETALAADTDPAAAAAAPARVPVTFSEAVDTTLACDFGGTIDTHLEVSGTGDDETGEAELTLAIVQTHRGCVVGDAEQPITIDGRPNVTATFVFYLSAADSIRLGGGIDGTIRASAGGHSGLCAVDISFAGGLNAEGVGEFGVLGTMCGAAVDESVPVD